MVSIKQVFRLLIFNYLLIISSSSFGNTPCLYKLTSNVKITQADLDLCVEELIKDKENSRKTFCAIVNELTKKEYQPVQSYFIASDIILELKPNDTISVFQRYLAMKKILKKIVQSKLIEEEIIIENLNQIVLPCTFNSIFDLYSNPSKTLIEKLEKHLVNNIDTKLQFHESLRINYARTIIKFNNYNVSKKLASFFINDYPKQLSRMITIANNNGRLDLVFPGDTRNLVLKTLFEQIENENMFQSYSTVQTIEDITTLKFINKYFRFPDRDRHYKAVRKKALKYYRKNYQ